jgi:endonuclease/exonuclease/phosphatase family metal-dependent hydrolase
VQQILDYLESVAHARLIVLGDFNDWMPGRTAADVLDRRLGRSPRPKSFPAGRPLVALDRIWVRPPEALQRVYAHVTPASRLASDHLPIVADITWPAVERGTPIAITAIGD